MDVTVNQAPERYLYMAALLNALATNFSDPRFLRVCCVLREQSHAGFIETLSAGAALHARTGSNVARKECRTRGLIFRPAVCAAVFELVDPSDDGSFGAHRDGFTTGLVHAYREARSSGRLSRPSAAQSHARIRRSVSRDTVIS
jgi:hypothetical protein